MPDSVPDMSDTDMMSYMMSYMIQVVNSWLCTLDISLLEQIFWKGSWPQ